MTMETETFSVILQFTNVIHITRNVKQILAHNWKYYHLHAEHSSIAVINEALLHENKVNKPCYN